MRQAERAIFDLRRGLPVLVRNNGSDTLVQAVEGLNDSALAALQALSGSPACLVLSSHRMAALGFSEVKTPVTAAWHRYQTASGCASSPPSAACNCRQARPRPLPTRPARPPSDCCHGPSCCRQR